jgi:hypothetical protein
MRRGRVHHKRHLVIDPSQKQKSAVMQRGNSGQLDTCKARPVHCPRTDFDPEFARAAKHRADADLIAPATIAELIGFSVHAMKAQEQSQCSKPQICGVGISILDCHFFTLPFGNRSDRPRLFPSHAFPKTGNSTVAHRQGTRHTACSQPKRRKQLSKH